MSSKGVVIVTGASSGIGRGLARFAAKDGYAVVAVARRKERLDALAAEISAVGGTCAIIVVDVTAADAPKRIVSQALLSFGRIDALVHNAGAAVGGTLLSQSQAQIDGQWQLHVAAPLRITREAFGALQQSRGQVIFIGSGVAQIPLPFYGAYCAAKAAMRALATQLRRELRGSGVTVTYVDPGTVETEFSLVSGMRGWAPGPLLAKSEYVAKRILRAMQTRPAYMNAVRWQGWVVSLGAFFWPITDLVLSRAMRPSTLVKAEPLPSGHPERSAERVVEGGPSAVEANDFESALEPVARRMERVNLSPNFLKQLLVLGSEIRLSDAAVQWAGMPNKNERAVLHDALAVLAAAGFLEPLDDQSWRVSRASQ